MRQLVVHKWGPMNGAWLTTRCGIHVVHSLKNRVSHLVRVQGSAGLLDHERICRRCVPQKGRKP